MQQKLLTFQKEDIARAKKTDEVTPDDDVVDDGAGGDSKPAKSSSKKKASKSALEAEQVGEFNLQLLFDSKYTQIIFSHLGMKFVYIFYQDKMWTFLH